MLSKFFFSETKLYKVNRSSGVAVTSLRVDPVHEYVHGANFRQEVVGPV